MIIQRNTNTSARVRSHLLATAAAFIALSVSLGGCGKAPSEAPASEDHGHDHAASHDAAHEAEPGATHEAPHDTHGAEAGHSDEVTLTAEAVTRYGITLGRVSRIVLADSVPAPARVAFNTETMAHVGSSLRGRVVEAKVRVGDAVKEGQELLIIESPELGEAQADLLQRRNHCTNSQPGDRFSEGRMGACEGSV